MLEVFDQFHISHQSLEAITERLHEAGFQISSEKHIELSREMASQLYQEHEGKEFYESLLDHMTR